MKKCSGCGIVLQTLDKDKDGYVASLDKELCYRCFRLKNYGEYKKVEKNNLDYMKIIDDIEDNSLVLYVSSLLDLNLDYVNKFKRVILVLTKRDIIPKSVIDDKICNYVTKRYKNIIDVVVVSSFNNYNLDRLFKKIEEYNDGEKVYVVGNTNSGKSTLVNKMIKNYGNDDVNITESMYPETTLEKVEIDINGIKMVDTPGLCNDGSIINYIDMKTLKRITPKKEIKPLTYQLKGQGSLLVDNLVRIDYDVDSGSSMTCYLARGLVVKKISSKRDDFKDCNPRNINIKKREDIVIEGLGFIKFTDSVKLTIYTYNGVKITKRDSLI